MTSHIRQFQTHILVAIVFLSLIVLAITAVIAAEQHQWKLSEDPSKCFTDPQAGCFMVQHSVYAETFGIPNTLLSLIGFMAVIIVAVMLIMEKGPGQYLEWALISMLGVGALFALWFLYVQHFILRAYCTFCIPIDILSLIICGLALIRYLALPNPAL